MTPSPPTATGRVLRIDAKVCHVEVQGRRLQVPLRGRLFESTGYEKLPVAVGDLVRVTLDADGSAIEAVLPRSSKLSRRASGEGTREQVIAANVTLIMIVAAIREPPFQPLLVDAILVGAKRQELATCLVISKIDRDRKREAQHWVDLYRSLGYTVAPTSLAPGEETIVELAALGQLLHANTTVLSGASGVGKSSLINRLVPGLDLRIGSMSRVLQGKHTTTSTQLIPLPGGGYVLDTPGIRNFGLFGVDPQELSFYFPEIAPLVPGCEYRDCTHLVEQQCAVRRAVADGSIARSRFASYEKMFKRLLRAEEE